MVAVTGPTSILELSARGVASFLAARRARRGERGSIFGFLGELLGTLLAMTAFTVAAFAVGFALGMVVAGVALLLLDFKISVVRRARATTRRGAR